MKLIVQPDHGIEPILSAIARAKKTIDVRGGERHLRKLELHLLEQGGTVSRTADNLVRYHGKMMIVDGRILHVYGFNFTALDIDKSRSFGIVTRNRRLVQEATRLFSADFDRHPYVPATSRLVVSPENSRERLAEFLRGARKQLLIYDPGLTDDGMLRLIAAKLNAGVDVKILGKVEAKWQIPFEKYPGKRLHVRTIIRDGQRAFVGSQSLRKLELDKRREVGVFVTDRAVVTDLMAVFARDWVETPTGRKAAKKTAKTLKAGKRLGPDEKLIAAAV